MQRPRPVLTASAVAGAVTGVALILAFLGFSDASAHLSGEAQVIGSMVAGIIGVGGHLVSAIVSQEKVTPLSDPRDANGNPLVKYEPLLASVGEVGSVLKSEYDDMQQVSPALHRRLEAFLQDVRAEVSPLVGKVEDLIGHPAIITNVFDDSSGGRHAAPETPPDPAAVSPADPAAPVSTAADTAVLPDPTGVVASLPPDPAPPAATQ